MGHLIALVAPKGGIGCTTVALTMATVLRKAHGPKVLLVEGDLMFGDLATMVGVRPDRSLLDVLDKPRPWTPNIVSRAVIHHPVLNFDVALAPSEPHYSEKITVRHFTDFLDAVLQAYDFVIVDVATAMGTREIEIFDRASAIYLLTAPDPVTLTSTRKMIRVFTLLRDPMKKMAVVCNNAPCSENSITEGDLENGLGLPLLRQIPRGRGDEFDYQNLRLLEPFTPWGDAQKVLCELTREIRDALWTGQKAPGILGSRKASAPSFNPYVAIAGKDISGPPQRTEAPSPSPEPVPPVPPVLPDPSPPPPPEPREKASSQARESKRDRLRKTLSERLRISRSIKQDRLPKHIQDPSAVPLQPTAGDPRARQIGEINLLVGDDNASFRAGLCRALGFEDRLRVVAEASDGKEALDLVTVHKPHVVLLDANMPRLSGLQAAATIKRLLPQTVVLVMSVQGDAAFIEEAKSQGADRFLVKPFEPEDVSRVLNEFFPA